jgi:hypothetical protein
MKLTELQKYEWKAYRWAAKRGIAFVHKDLAKLLLRAYRRGYTVGYGN